MKKVVSVSLGSSKRNHTVEVEILGEQLQISRIGTDGDLEKAKRLIRELDGQVDALGLGGIDLYLYAGNKRYILREALQLAQMAKKTPIVDGSGLKNTLERRVIKYLHNDLQLPLADQKILMVCAMDRFGMAQSFAQLGCDTIYGDLIFALGVPVPLKNLKTLEFLAQMLVPAISLLPIKYLYPTGSKQEDNKPSHHQYYQWADIITGDFHFIRRYMPENLAGKTIITNTVTVSDVEMLKSRGVHRLITTTPDLAGRSFGTNVMEGVLVSLLGKRPEELSSQDYETLLDKIEFKPRIEDFLTAEKLSS